MRRVVCIVLACVGWLLSSVAQAITVGFYTYTTYPNSYVDSELQIVGLGGPGVSPHLGAFALDITFDPNIISLYSVTFQGGLGDPDLRSFTRSGMTLVPGLPGTGQALTSATLSLSASSPDYETVHLIEVSLLPVNDPVLTQQDASFTLAVLLFMGEQTGLSTAFSNLTITPEYNPVTTDGGLSDEWGNSLPYRITHTNVYVIQVPEIDTASGAIAIGLLLGVLALLGERRRCPQPEAAG